MQLAKWLKGNAFIKKVDYAGLPDNRNYLQALRYFKNSFGNKLSFSLFSDEGTIRHIVDSLKARIQEDSNGNKNYKVTFNPTDLTIEVLIKSGSAQKIISDFRYALDDVHQLQNYF